MLLHAFTAAGLCCNISIISISLASITRFLICHNDCYPSAYWNNVDIMTLLTSGQDEIRVGHDRPHPPPYLQHSHWQPGHTSMMCPITAPAVNRSTTRLPAHSCNTQCLSLNRLTSYSLIITLTHWKWRTEAEHEIATQTLRAILSNAAILFIQWSRLINVTDYKNSWLLYSTLQHCTVQHTTWQSSMIACYHIWSCSACPILRHGTRVKRCSVTAQPVCVWVFVCYKMWELVICVCEGINRYPATV